MNELETVLGATCSAIREKFSKANVSEFFLEITVEGRVDSLDTLKVSYVLGRYHDDAKVKGCNLPSVVAEHLRRRGWEENNDYKALPAPKTLADEIEEAIEF